MSEVLVPDSSEDEFVDDTDDEVRIMDKIEEGNIDYVRRYIDRGYDINAVEDDVPSMPLLSFAIYYNRNSIAELLINSGADLDKIDDYGNTPLHIAILEKNKDISINLIMAGADISIQDRDGNTALLLIMQELYDNRYLYGLPTHFTEKNKLISIGLSLINNNADLFIKNNDNKNAFIYSKKIVGDGGVYIFWIAILEKIKLYRSLLRLSLAKNLLTNDPYIQISEDLLELIGEMSRRGFFNSDSYMRTIHSTDRQKGWERKGDRERKTYMERERERDRGNNR